MRRFVIAAALAALTLPAGAGVGPRSKCDNEKSRLCDGLVAVYEFEEGLSSGSTPTYPDAVRRNAFGLGDLYEPDAVDVGAGSTQTGVNNGKLGKNAYTFAQPTDFSGLRLWLKADAITGVNEGGEITSWPDSSGNGYNGTAGSGVVPLYRTGVLNGKPVARFDGVDDRLNTTALSNLISASDYTVFVVYKHTSGGTPILLHSDSGGFGQFDLRNTSTGNNIQIGNYDGTADGAISGDPSTGVFYIATAKHTSGSIFVGAGDTRDANLDSVASGNTSVLSANLYVGINAVGLLNPFGGDIAEIIVYNVSLSEADRKKIESYLANKYNLTLPYEPVGGTSTDDPDAVEFDGASQYLHLGMDVRGVGILGNPAPWTVAFWVYADTSGATGQDQVIWSENGVQNGAPRLGTEIEFTNDGTKFFPRVRVYDALTEAATTVSWASNVTTSAWHLVVVTFRPRSLFTNGELSISVDGGTKVTAAISGNGGILTGVGPIIGRRANTSDPDFFDGRLDQLTIAGIEWNAQDIAAFYNGGAGREYPFLGN